MTTVPMTHVRVRRYLPGSRSSNGVAISFSRYWLPSLDGCVPRLPSKVPPMEATNPRIVGFSRSGSSNPANSERDSKTATTTNPAIIPTAAPRADSFDDRTLQKAMGPQDAANSVAAKQPIVKTAGGAAQVITRTIRPATTIVHRAIRSPRVSLSPDLLVWSSPGPPVAVATPPAATPPVAPDDIDEDAAVVANSGVRTLVPVR